MRIALVSDTHGLLRPQLFTRLAGVDHILHAGDVGTIDQLIELEAIAPVTAVWGNTDGWELRERLPERAVKRIGEIRVGVLHGHQLGSPTPASVAAEFDGADLAVFGHTHRPVIERIGETLAVNPGSAGPRRFTLPVCCAIATVKGGEIDVEPVELA